MAALNIKFMGSPKFSKVYDKLDTVAFYIISCDC